MGRVLQGIRVLETSSFVSGPYACQMLAEYGADVVKVEQPKGGDPFRSFAPDLYSATFCAHNRHKRSITLDLTKPEGAAAFRKLAATMDVLVENFRPGVMDKLGLGYADLSALNPRLVYCAISGFGPTGPYRHRPAYDTVIQAISGLLGQVLAPDNPRISGPNFADSVSSLYAVSGVMGALFERERTGMGRRIDVPMIDAMIGFLTNPIGQYFALGTTPGPYQRPSQSQCFVFRCADGRVISIHMSAPEKFWEGMLHAIGRPDLRNDPRFSTNPLRIQNYEELGRTIAPSFLTRTRAEWERLLDDNDVPYAPVNDFDEVIADPQVRHLAIFEQTEHPTMGTVKGPARPVLYDGTRDFDRRPPPLLGEHTNQILVEIGLSANEIAAMRASNAI
ncbi:MAG: CoA transferase [Hyphomicrobiales bacterium]|nr:CoA transferase [Hyphomicrobiales bacterium]